MSRMWLKNGRAVLTDGRAVLCAECPCDQGCRYTYYVDHSLVTSGDGLTWETAFNSVNDVFNSVEIYNYRTALCEIYVKIRGIVSYALSGSYLFHTSELGTVYLLPPDDNSRVICNISVPLIDISSPWSVYIQFKKWDISAETRMLYYISNILFADCTFSIIADITIYSYIIYGGSVSFDNCSIVVTVFRAENAPGTSLTWNRFVFYNKAGNCHIRNTTMNVVCNIYGMDGTSDPYEWDPRYFYFSWIESPYNCVFENILMQSSGSVISARRMSFEFFTITRSPNIFNSCSGEFSLSFSPGVWQQMGECGVCGCLFHGYQNTISAQTFFNCEQKSYIESYNGFECDSSQCDSLS